MKVNKQNWIPLYSFCLCMAFISPAAKAMDTLYLRNGSIKPVKVLAVYEHDIEYSLGTFQSGVYRHFILRSALIRICYDNGSIDSFASEAAEIFPKFEVDRYKTEWKNNTVSMGITDCAFGLLSFNYERKFMKGKFSMNAPLSIGWLWLQADPESSPYVDGNSSSLDYYSRFKQASLGLQANYFPFGQGKFTYSIGVLADYGYSGLLTYQDLIVQNAFAFSISKHIQTTFLIGVGGHNSFRDNKRTFGGSTARIGLQLGYTFN